MANKNVIWADAETHSRDMVAAKKLVEKSYELVGLKAD